MISIVTRKEARSAGLKRYFTGSPCQRGHLVEHYASDGMCVECARANAAAWGRANKDRKALQGVRYRLRHTEKLRARSREWNQSNSEKEAARKKRRREAIQDLLSVLRVEMPDLLKEFGL